ncbi:MAG: sigma-54 dependent transcriptional regulator [Polyangia bacterium]
MSGRCLLVEDEAEAAGLLQGALTRRGFSAMAVNSGAQAIRTISEGEWDVVVTDVNLGGMSGIELCTHIAEHRPDLPVVVVTGHGSFETAVAAIRAGAYDFITKPISVDALVLTLNRAIQHRHLKSEVRRLREAVQQQQRPGDILGDSAAIRRVFQLIERVASSDTSVLVTGESGTGKELVARAVHARSNRATAPFVAINCAAVPATLLESELFGHVRGAFTDAKQSRPGLFLQASGGTVFLDEVAEMSLEMQAKLLRVLQERMVRPVGGDAEVAFNTRLIAATNRDLESEVEAGRFRSDLYYRINVVHLALPPLRARKEDILPLAQHFLRKFARSQGKPVVGIASPAARKLLEYNWPGNVRELENCIERAVALTGLTEIGLDDLPDKIVQYKSSQIVINTDNVAELVTLDEMEQRYIRQVLAAVGGNKSQAARILGLDRRSLYRRLEGQPANGKDTASGA